MYKKSHRVKIAHWVSLLCLLCVSNFTFGLDDDNWKSNTFSQDKESDVSLPARVVPVLVEAPPRRLDLLPGSPGIEKAAKSATSGASLSLAGLPVDMYEFPVLRFKTPDQGARLYGIEFALDTRGKGTADTLVRVGNPALFPDMEQEHIDLGSTEFVPRDLSYKVKRALRVGRDKKWRYTAINARVDSIANGIVHATYEPGGDFVMQRAFDSSELSKTPWLQYEYELPEGQPWIMQINAKIARGKLNPILTTLSSEPVKGGGQRRVLVNLFDLLQKANPGAKDGQLEQLIIHFKLEETAGTATQDVRIGLGHLGLYHAQTPAQADGSVVLLAAIEVGKDLDLLDTLGRRLSSKDKLTILGGRLVGARRDIANKSGDLPRISLLTEYREKIPELFVGERFLLDELNGSELAAVLDQKVFYQKRLLWESGQSDVIFRNVNAPTLPLISFAQNTTLDGDSYIKADFIFEDGKQYPLQLTLFGIDIHGRTVQQDYQLTTNTPIKVKNIQTIRRATLSFSQEVGVAIPFPASCLVRSIQVSSFSKSTTYRPKQASALAALVPAGKPLWRAKPARFDIAAQGDGNVHSFPVESKIVGEAILHYELETIADESPAYGLRVRAIEGGRYVEKTFSLNQRGELPFSNLYLRSLEIVVIRGAQDSLPASLLLKRLEIENKGEKANGSKELLPPKPIGHFKITYLAPHKSLYAPAIAWMRPAYATQLAKTDPGTMHRLDTTLSYAQILDGGKDVVLPREILAQGKYELNYVGDEDVSVVIEPSFLQSNRDQQSRANVKEEGGGPAHSKLAKLGLVVLAVAFIWLGIKTMPNWVPLVDKALSMWMLFWGIQLVLLTTSLYLIFAGLAKDAVSWGELLLVFAYGLAVHYKIRPHLAKKWAFFSKRYSAPYLLLFLILLLFCAELLMCKQDLVAEHIAVLGYYLLVTGVAIEFICFAKEAQQESKSTLTS